MKQVIAWTDGASKGNPGPSSFGSICEVDGNLIFEDSFDIGNHTNNEAEYSGLVYTLSKIIACGLETEDVKVKMDSQLVVRQINGEYKVKKKELKFYYKIASNLMERFDKIAIIHIVRELNKSADRMANLAFESR
jgi:ribonuclease HI